MSDGSSSAPCKTAGRIPVTLVTGFLGSGKTTFINAALKAPGMAGTVVVVNEFGEIGLDHALMTESNDTVIVLENGCLCCTVRSDLVATLTSLHQSRRSGSIPAFDNIVIETSGLAEPAPILQAFLSEPTLDGCFRVASVVTLVDAVNWSSTILEHDEALRQVALADRVLITKLDLLATKPGEDERELRLALARLTPTATIAAVDHEPEAIAKLLTPTGFDAGDPKADPRPWIDLAAQQRAHASEIAPDHDFRLRGKSVESFVLVRDHPLSRQELQFLLDGITQNLGSGLLRVKGLVNVAGEPGRPAVIQGAQHLLHTMTWLEKWPDADQRTRIVFITQGIARERLHEAVETLDRMSARTFKARERGRLARTAVKDA